MTEQDLAAARRHLAESRRENDDLLKAVDYLRSKLDAAGPAPTGDDDTPTDLHMHDNGDVTTVADAAAGAADDDVDHIDDEYDEELQELSPSSELNSHSRRLLEQLRAAAETRRRLQRELASTRRDADAMVETLRRKERQFADERKQLERKNHQLSDVFDLFAERSAGLAHRRRKCAAARRDQLNDAIMSCRTSDDVATQTDDVSVVVVGTPTGPHANTVQSLRHRVGQLEMLIRDKDETIRRHVEMLERNDVIAAEMTRTMTSLETSVAASRDLLADKERALAARIGELDSKTAECRRTRQLLDASSETVRQLQTNLARTEGALSEKQRDLDRRSRRVTELESDNADLRAGLTTLSARLEETKLQLNGAWSDKKRAEKELEKTSRATEELKLELKESREQARKLAAERRKPVKAVMSGTSDDDRILMKQQQQQQQQTLTATMRHQATVLPPAAAGATSVLPVVSASRKLFDVQVKHEKSFNVSPAVTRRDITAGLHGSSPAAPSRQSVAEASSDVMIASATSNNDVDSSQFSQQSAEGATLHKQEVVDEMTSQTAAVVRLRDRSTTSGAPTAFRRSRSMSEVDVLAANDAADEDVMVFHEQLVEPIQLTLFAPQLATSVTPSPTVTAPSGVTSSLLPFCDVTRRAVTSSSSLSPSPFYYESGTMSASVSRDQSPQRYPRPPPSMIISPAHRRSLSADRTTSCSSSVQQRNNAALQRIVKRLSDVIDIDDDVTRSGGVAAGRRRGNAAGFDDVVDVDDDDDGIESGCTAASAAGRCHGNGGGGQQQQQVAAGSDARTPRDPMTSEVGGMRVGRKAASHTEISSPSALTAAPSPTSVSARGSTSNSRLSRWTATLALFRRKTRRTENNKLQSSLSSSSSSATVLARPLQEQWTSLSSGDVWASVETCSLPRGAHSELSQSQPLHYGTAVSLHPPAASSSGLLATNAASTSSWGASKLARIIDPLKLRRRRPNSSSGDLRTTLLTSSGSEVTSRRPLTARSATRRTHHSLTSAYMQGSL